MILGRESYLRASLFRRYWLRRQASKLRIQSPFFQAGTFQSSGNSFLVPEFAASAKDLAEFADAKKLEKICPTSALAVTAQKIEIKEKNCIGCMECVKASPENFFRVKEEKFPDGPDTN